MPGLDNPNDVDEFATALINGYVDTAYQFYGDVVDAIKELGLQSDYFPISSSRIGTDWALVFLRTPHSLYGSVVQKANTFAELHVLTETDGFGDRWYFDVPPDQQREDIKAHSAVADYPIVQSFQLHDPMLHHGVGIDTIRKTGYSCGRELVAYDGPSAKSALPELQKSADRERQQDSFEARYRELGTSDVSPQERGQRFEILWREILQFHGWKPRKIRIAGEENDFTAILEGSHILGEVRWYSDPMTGARMREFLAKLDPRPQTIGLFVSHSGFDEGAVSVVKRSVNTKTVVLYGRHDIEAVIVDRTTPDELFADKLRTAYDYIFERVGNNQ